MIKNNTPEEEFDLDAELDKLEALFGKKEGEEEKELYKVDIDELFNEVMGSDLQEKPLQPIKEIFEAQFPRKSLAIEKEEQQTLVQSDFAREAASEIERTQAPKRRLRKLAIFSLAAGAFLFAHFMGSTLKQDLRELEEVAQDTVATVSEDIKKEESTPSAVGGVTPANTSAEQSASKGEGQPTVAASSDRAAPSTQEENSGQIGEQLLMSQRGEAPSEERDTKLQTAAELLSQASKTNRSSWIGLLETRRQLTDLPRQRMEQYLKEGPSLEASTEVKFLLNNLEAYKTRLKQYLTDYQEAMKQGIAPQYRKYHQAIASSLQRQVYQLETLQKELVEWSGEQEHAPGKDYSLLRQRLSKALAFVPAPYFNR